MDIFMPSLKVYTTKAHTPKRDGGERQQQLLEKMPCCEDEQLFSLLYKGKLLKSYSVNPVVVALRVDYPCTAFRKAVFYCEPSTVEVLNVRWGHVSPRALLLQSTTDQDSSVNLVTKPQHSRMITIGLYIQAKVTFYINSFLYSV